MSNPERPAAWHPALSWAGLEPGGDPPTLSSGLRWTQDKLAICLVLGIKLLKLMCGFCMYSSWVPWMVWLREAERALRSLILKFSKSPCSKCVLWTTESLHSEVYRKNKTMKSKTGQKMNWDEEMWHKIFLGKKTLLDFEISPGFCGLF